MKDMSNTQYQNSFNDEIDIQELINVLWNGKWIIIAITTFVSIIGVIYSLSLPNMYKSVALLNPVNPSSNFSKSLQNYAGLAGIAGANFQPATDESNAAKALKKLESLSFFENQILPNIYLPDLMAIKFWDFRSNTVIHDNKIYIADSNTWVRKFSYPFKQIPSAQESFNILKENHLNVSEDKNSGFVTISIEHQSPFISKEWVELMVNQVNAFYRQKDKLESEKAINYLNKQILMTNISEVKEAISMLLQEETKKLALIEANSFYVFEYIDPPAIMELKSSPKRALICILFALIGGIISTLYVLIKYYVFRKTIKESEI